MKTFLYKALAIIFLVMFSSSCTDFLKEDPKGKIMDDSAFSQRSDLEGAIHALNRQVVMATKGSIPFTGVMLGDDISTHPASNKADRREFDNYDVSDTNSSMTIDTGSWYWMWKVVKAANYIISGVRNTPDVTEDEIIFALGQAYYWRAWAYLYMVRFWGPLPKIVTGDIDLNIGVSPVSEIFDLIVSDLQEAEKLPANYTESPWALNGVNTIVSKGAAQATLAYVYLSMAGWPLNKGSEYYQKAAAKALEVIEASDNGTYYYKLYDEYWKIHSKEYNLNNTEAILAVYYSSITGTGDGSQSARGCIEDIHEISGGYNNIRGEFGFYCDFPEGPRKEWTYAPVTYHLSKGQAYPWWSEEIPEEQRQPYFRKSAFTTDGNSADQFEYDHALSFESQCNGWTTQIHQIVRLSEVYCWYAEAIGRSGQINAKAIEVLNKVRNRADGAETNLYASISSPEALAEAAYNEHGWEIAGWCWGNFAARYFNMQRMDRVKDHFNYRKQNPEREVVPGVFMKEPFGPAGEWSQSKMYVPYPAPDVRMNPNLANVDKLNLIN
ncbi:MAG: RagB/SusD family nutrient uptake outer membrane protein [Tannerellaceae bacterium]|jgi:hypothetical protein|nr:RagB/SusD family nutrient uptake outer membrane protein [Tannerellaceae bacterium]